MEEKKEIFRPYTDLAGKRRDYVENALRQLQMVEGVTPQRGWSVLIVLGAWLWKNHPELYREAINKEGGEKERNWEIGHR